MNRELFPNWPVIERETLQKGERTLVTSNSIGGAKHEVVSSSNAKC